MSLIGALNTGQSALAIAQASIQVSGNNISNAADPNYTRQTVQTAPAPDQQVGPGIFIGSGVDLTSVQRQIDDALTARLRASVSDNQSASTTQQWLTQVQSVFNALGTNNLSRSMNTFFSDWSSLANKPQDMGLRQVVLQDGQNLAQTFNSQVQQLQSLNTSASSAMTQQAQSADTLASQVASLNGQIVVAQGGTGGTANALLDQRDAVLKQLSQLMNVTTVRQPNGAMDVYVGSEPLVSNTISNGVSIANVNVSGTITPTVVFKSNGAPIPLGGGGQLGAMGDVQARITGVVTQENTLAHNLIFELNKLHSSGQGLQGQSSVTAANAVANAAQPLNSAAAGLQFTPVNGSFVVHVTDKATGQDHSTLVQVNLTGSPSDTTLNSLAASLNGISGVQATVSGGTLSIAAANNAVDLSFSQDSSGALAALGINTFYTGNDATDIAVNKMVSSQPQLLAAAKNGDSTDNQTALAIAALGSQPVTALGGTSLNDTYQSMINGVASQVSTAQTNAQAAQAVQNTLQSQRDSLSGVSLDEEAMKLMKQQQAYQGAARLVYVVEQLMQSLIAMVQ